MGPGLEIDIEQSWVSVSISAVIFISLITDIMWIVLPKLHDENLTKQEKIKTGKGKPVFKALAHHPSDLSS